MSWECVECGMPWSDSRKRCECGAYRKEAAMAMTDSCAYCGKKACGTVAFKSKGSIRVCTKHYLVFAKNDMIARYGLEFCKEKGVLSWD